jgi:DNA-binding transcriptional regulator PaaX
VRVTAFCVDHVHGVTGRSFAREHWDLDALGTEYAKFLDRFEPLLARHSRSQRSVR